MLFKLNDDYYPYIFFKKDINPYFRSCFADKLAKELKDLLLIYYQKLLDAQKF